MILLLAGIALGMAVGYIARGYDPRFCPRCDQVSCARISGWRCGVCRTELD